MSAEEVAPVADRLEAAVKRPMAALSADDRRFWIGVICALLLHAALIFGFTRSYNGAYDRPPLGDRSGSADGISVEIIDAADLLSRETVALRRNCRRPKWPNPNPSHSRKSRPPSPRPRHLLRRKR